MAMSAPVMNEALSEARNETRYATSSGVAPRPRAVASMNAFRPMACIFFVIWVSIRPGEIVLARTPASASSAAMLLVNEATAALEAE